MKYDEEESKYVIDGCVFLLNISIIIFALALICGLILEYGF